MWEIKIQPKQFYLDAAKPKITTLRIFPFEHIPESGIKYRIELLRDKMNLYDSDYDIKLDTKIYVLQGSDYANWTNDTPYLENLILNFIDAVREE